jgi:hypothetical protein
VVGTLSALYGLRNADTILGLSGQFIELSAPSSPCYLFIRKIAPEPLAHLYSPDYYRATWINTALDTGFATAMPIRPKFLRDIISMLLSGYYLVYAREADEKVPLRSHMSRLIAKLLIFFSFAVFVHCVRLKCYGPLGKSRRILM